MAAPPGGLYPDLPPPIPPGPSSDPSQSFVVNQAIFSTDSLLSQENSQAVITDFRIRSHYERDYGRYMLGVSSPTGFNGSSVAFVQLRSPTLLWVADWTGASFLDKPSVPDPTTVSTGWVLLDVWLDPAEIVLAQNGVTPLFRLTGTYVFGQQNPGSSFYNGVAYPAAPWFTSDGFASLRTIAASDLATGLLQPQTVLTTNPPGNLGPGITLGG